MDIEINKFGTLLISRPAGKEAFAAAKAYTLPPTLENPEIVLNFAKVEVLSPSWADEFITGIRELYKNCSVKCINTDNPSVKATLEILKI
ncbi:MAG: DUF4325 domain-containing protein [Candidatus Margulisbacteria bacterium]|nr:DUF4325 domain-containing protein [Candidatus Margulisiibacteriota bacterium]